MATYVLPFALDSSAQGIPTGDGGRGVGWFVQGDTDYGRAVLTASDGKIVLNQIVGVQKPRIRFWANWTNVAELVTLLGLNCSGQASSQLGVINSITPVAVHRRQAVTSLDTAPVPVIATMENPAGVNLTTIWSFDLSDTSFVTTIGPAFPTAPDGSPWTAAVFLTAEFSLQLIDVNGGFHPYASQYIVDQFYVSVDYSVPSPFPVSTGGGQACSADVAVTSAGTGHGWQS